MELWWARHRIDTSYGFTSSAIEGNTVLIRNLSNRPIIIEYWEQFAAHDKGGKEGYDVLALPDSLPDDTQLAAMSTLTLRFCEADYFGTTPKYLKCRRIYLKLWVAGRKPATYKVYP